MNIRRLTENRRIATDAAARELLKQLVELSAYTPLDPDEEVLVRMLRSRFQGVDE